MRLLQLTNMIATKKDYYFLLAAHNRQIAISQLALPGGHHGEVGLASE